MSAHCTTTACAPAAAVPPATTAEPTDEDRELARLTKALGHPARVAIVRYLGRLDSCFAGDIVEVLPLAQSTVSQHLKKLKEAGLIHGEVAGPRVCYWVNREALNRLSALLRGLPSRGDGDAPGAGGDAAP